MPTTEKAAHPTAAWLQERIAFEALPENAIMVPADLVKPHPLVKAAAAVVRAEVGALQSDRDRRERPLKPGERPQLFLGPSWREYVKRGFLEMDPEVLPMRVSIESADRALRLWNALLRACEARGLRVTLSGRRVKVSDGADTVDLRLNENLTPLKQPAKRGRSATLTRRPPGCLRIVVNETKIEDSADCPLEQQLNDVLVRIHRSIASQRKWRPIAAERQRNDEAAAKVRDQERAAAAEVARLREEEEQRSQAEQAAAAERERMLVAEADAWRDAMTIRAYAAHVEAAADGAPAQALRDWLVWAESVAERLDPTLKRLE